MKTRSLLTITFCFLGVARVCAQEVQFVARDGVTYRETTRIERKPVVEQGWVTQTRTEYRDKYVTEIRDTYRSTYIPMTEYRCEPYWQNWWNPLAPPCTAYRVRPTVCWTARVEKTQIPITIRQTVPETRVVQVPVRKLGWTEEEVVDRVVVNAPQPMRTPHPSAQAAGRIGGIARLSDDRPHDAMPATSLGNTIRR